MNTGSIAQGRVANFDTCIELCATYNLGSDGGNCTSVLFDYDYGGQNGSCWIKAESGTYPVYNPSTTTGATDVALLVT